MVGNDIVDLNEASRASNWQRPRLLDKLFSEQEQAYINSAENAFKMVWRLWSMKEASYKLYTQIAPSRFYNPKAFQCTIKEDLGTVKCKNFSCFVQSKITSNYIISEASLKKQKLNSEIIEFVSLGYAGQSDELKAKLIDSLDSKFRIEKNAFDVPILSNGKELFHVSLSHHGRYGAYVRA